MDCKDILELAPLYVAGELDAKRASEFDAHLKICPACMRHLEVHARLDARLREVLLAEELDVSHVNRRIREMLSADIAGSLEPHLKPKPRPWVTVAMGIAASLLLLAAGYVLFPGHTARVYADAAIDHRMEVVEQQPRPWITEPEKIESLAQQEGITDYVPVDLASGYHLVRGKICRLDGRSFLHLVYSNGSGEFSLFLRPRDGQALSGTIRGFANGRFLHTSVSGNEHVSSFETSRLTAMVVTDQSSEAALHFAKAASAAL